MTKRRSEVIEYSLLGLLLGVMTAIKLFLVIGPFVLIFLLGLPVLGGISTIWIRSLPDRAKHTLRYYITGVIVGAMIGFSLLQNAWLGIPAGLVVGVAFYRFLVCPWIARLKEKDKYLSYPCESFMVPLFAFIGTLAGASVYFRIVKAFPHLPAWSTPEIHILLVLICSLLSVPLGIMVASNRYRPVIGGVLLMIAGGLVTWVGINVASMLFMPGSGLYWMGMIVGLGMIAVACLAIAFWQMHLALGITAIILSLLSFLGAVGGLIIGGILGILSGAIVLAWEGVALPESAEVPEEPDTRFIVPPGDTDIVVSQ